MNKRAHQTVQGAHSYSPRPGVRPTFLPRYSSLLLLLLVGLEAGVARFIIRDFRAVSGQVRRIYASSVLGLRRIGGLQYDAQETRRTTLYALSTNDSNLQVEYADQSREADHRVTQGIDEYVQASSLPDQVDLARRLQRDWKAYLGARDEVLASILEGSAREAVSFDLTQAAPLFDRVRQDLDETQRLYDQQASESLANLSATERRSIIKLIAVLVCTVLLASIFVWVLQKNRITSALQFARMQIDFAASVSHELRTPLAVLCSAVDNVADGLVTGKDQVSKYVSLIRNQTRQIDGLVNQVLLFAATQEGRARYTMRPVPVPDVIESAVADTAELVQRAGFVLERHLEPHLPFILGDVSALSHCLQNLITNALKYGGKDRWIAIDANCEDHKGEVQISVSDHGHGIQRSELRRIFEPFYRSPEVVAGQIHGTGLGLPIAKSLAEAMNGRLSVTSEVGVGSVFTLHLPGIQPMKNSAERQEGVARK